MQEYNSNEDISLLVSSCDLYEDAWNPFFRLLQQYWPDCPAKIYLVAETKTYTDSYFDINCIQYNSSNWSDRIIYALERIDSTYIWFFLEDFFLEKNVDETIVCAAINCIRHSSDIGVIKFIPDVYDKWYDSSVTIDRFFSPVPKGFRNRSNLMISLYRKDYFMKLLRRKESPWDFEKFGVYRSRRYSEKILLQNNKTDLAFPYNYQIKKGYGISSKKWLKNNKSLFEMHGIEVNYDNLGWYDINVDKPPKIIGLRRSFSEKLLMPVKNPRLFFEIVGIEVKNFIYCVRHFRHYF